MLESARCNIRTPLGSALTTGQQFERQFRKLTRCSSGAELGQPPSGRLPVGQINKNDEREPEMTGLTWPGGHVGIWQVQIPRRYLTTGSRVVDLPEMPVADLLTYNFEITSRSYTYICTNTNDLMYYLNFGYWD